MPFAKLGEQLKLPQTVCISVRGINALPFQETSFHWCDDVIFDSSTSGLDPDGGFKSSNDFVIHKIVEGALIGKCGYEPRDIVFLGFGQGGMAALNVAGKPKQSHSRGVQLALEALTWLV